jgi:SP family sugar:H+ symporter-like MFS transporter
VRIPVLCLHPRPAHTLSCSSLITATLSVGTFVGALAQAPVSDRWGRKVSMIIWAFFFLAGAVVQTAASTHVEQLYAGRVLAGLGVGALSGLCPLYLSETAPKAVRGLMISCYQFMIILGICVSYGITWASNNRNEDQVGWRVPIGFQIFFAVALIALMLPLPESPRWLLQRERDDDCRRVMANMRGLTLDNTAAGLRGSPAMEQDFEDMAEGIRAEADAFAGTNFFTAYALCFSRKNQMWRRTGTAMLMQLLQQLNGQNFYYYYGPIFFSRANVALQPLQIQFIFGIVSLICTIPALYLIERIGRRKMLITGAIVEG